MSEAADSTQSATKRRTSSKTRGEAPRHRGASATTVAPSLDDETAAALTLYNIYLAADRAQQAHERALRRAEKAKDEAAAAVRKLNDRKAPASEMAEAEAKYHDTVEALRRLRDGETAAPADEDEDDAGGGDAAATSDDDTTSHDDTPADETKDTTSENADDESTDDETADETSSVGVEASVGDEDLAGDEPAGVAG